MVRKRVFLAAILVAAAASEAGAADADGRYQVAQRWTPLTGFMSPENEQPASGDTSKSETPSKTEPAKPNKSSQSAAADSGKIGMVALRVVLERDTSQGQPRASLGVRAMALDADLAEALELGDDGGAIVTEVVSAAARHAELRAGDVIQRVDGRAIANPDALDAALKSLAPDKQVTVDVWRAGAGSDDLRKLLTKRAAEGNVAAAASLGRLLSLGLVLGSRDFVEAGRYYLEAAKEGHLASMTRYALFAKDGIGMAKDEALAASWFRKAADGGQEAAMTNLGSLYEAGRGVRRDYAEAARWYRRASDAGNVFAKQRLALMYEAGRGVEKNDDEAVRLLKAASEGGLSEATSWLADKYAEGRGIAKDEVEAARLNTRAADQVRRSADQGNAVATFNLGILHRIGKGVAKSDTEAAYWVLRSLRLGDKYLVAELMRNPDVLSLEDRKWLQEVLRDEGTYKGPINGTFSPEVRNAMEAMAGRA